MYDKRACEQWRSRNKELIADNDVFFWELCAWNFDDEFLFKFAVRVCRFNRDRFFLAFFNAFESCFQPWNDLANALKVAHWLVAE